MKEATKAHTNLQKIQLNYKAAKKLYLDKYKINQFSIDQFLDEIHFGDKVTQSVSCLYKYGHRRPHLRVPRSLASFLVFSPNEGRAATHPSRKQSA